MKNRKNIKNRKNYFGKEFNALPIEIQKEIILQNTSYYQQVLANLIVEINKLQIKYIQKIQDLRELQNPNSLMSYYINVNENKNKNYTYYQIQNAYNELINYYKPLIFNIKNEIKQLKKQLQEKIEEIKENKKYYYYFYNKLNKITKSITT